MFIFEITAQFKYAHNSNTFITHLQVPDQVWANEAVVESLELVTHGVITRFADNILQASHHVVNALEVKWERIRRYVELFRDF